MSYLIPVLITGLLLGSYLVVLGIERARGKRFFENVRTALDHKTERASFVARHVDWGSWSSHMLKLSLEKMAHDIVHGTLIVILSIEKGLTRAIRLLRARLADRGLKQKTEGFQLKETLEQFRKNLRKDS